MSTFVDFEVLKSRVRIEQTIGLLGLQMRQHGDQYRGPCPACKQGGDRALRFSRERAGDRSERAERQTFWTAPSPSIPPSRATTASSRKRVAT